MARVRRRRICTAARISTAGRAFSRRSWAIRCFVIKIQIKNMSGYCITVYMFLYNLPSNRSRVANSMFVWSRQLNWRKRRKYIRSCIRYAMTNAFSLSVSMFCADRNTTGQPPRWLPAATHLGCLCGPFLIRRGWGESLFSLRFSPCILLV